MRLCWELGQDETEVQFSFSWSEAGGRIPSPSRRGFGSTVIIDMVERKLEAQVDLNYEPTGMAWRMRCPAHAVVENVHDLRDCKKVGEAGQTAPSQKHSRPCVLVLEDDFLMSVEIAAILEDAGFTVIGPTHTVEEAMTKLRKTTCDAAVLDVNLGRGTSEPVALEPERQAKPFVVLSGYSRDQHPSALSGAPALSKPFRPQELIAMVTRCLDGRGGAKPVVPVAGS